MSTTCADLINDTRRLLFAGQRETLNKLVGDISAADTSVILANDLNAIAPGAYLSVGLEIMYVWSVASASKTATVERGQLGTTAATHDDGDLVYVNSRFPAFSLFQALNSDLNDLCAPSNGLFKVDTVEFNYNPAVQGYDLAAGILDILSVRAQIPGPSLDWVALTGHRLDDNADTANFPSGTSITLYQPGSAGLAVRVTYSAGFTPFTALSDTIASTGLPSTAFDIPPLGAAMSLTGTREIARNFTEAQVDPRRATEVPTNAQLAGYQALARERQRRIKNESQKLSSTWPNIRRGM